MFIYWHITSWRAIGVHAPSVYLSRGYASGTRMLTESHMEAHHECLPYGRYGGSVRGCPLLIMTGEDRCPENVWVKVTTSSLGGGPGLSCATAHTHPSTTPTKSQLHMHYNYMPHTHLTHLNQAVLDETMLDANQAPLHCHHLFYPIHLLFYPIHLL